MGDYGYCKSGDALYNSINPINITYRKPNQSLLSASAYAAQTNQTPIDADAQSKKENQQFPNGTKVAIDYTKNTINISQIVTDFKSTIVAINAPKEVSDEVYSYLALVEKESNKPNPQRDIIVSNLKNASKLSDAYIAKSLNKPSKVVEGWIDALFMQKIELKADPNHINPDFQLEIPEKKPKAPKNPTIEQSADEFVQNAPIKGLNVVESTDDISIAQNKTETISTFIEHDVDVNEVVGSVEIIVDGIVVDTINILSCEKYSEPTIWDNFKEIIKN